MTYLLIILILLVALAPIVWMKQSPRQEKIAQFRLLANRQGIIVSLTSAPDARETEGRLDKTKYTLNWPESLDSDIYKDHQWLLVKASRRGDSTPWQDWTWLSKRAANQYYSAIENSLNTLSDDVCGLLVDAKGIAFFWDEKGELAAMEANIKALRKLQKQLLN